MSEPPTKASAILDTLADLGARNETVCVGDVVSKFGDRSFGPMLFIPALVGLSPVGAIPGIPAFLAVIIAITGTQLAFGRKHLWLPVFLQQRGINGSRLEDAARKMAGFAHWLDKVFHGRVERLTDDPFPEIAAVAVLVLCVLIVPLELLPFAVMVPMAAIAAFGLALTVRDGLLMLASLGAALASGYLAWMAMTGGMGTGGGA